MFVHIAEPAAFYDAPDGKNELRRSGNWSLYQKGTPGFEALLAKFEHVLSRHPDTRFVAVHAFNLANDLGRVGGLLDRHPNVQVDFAARMWELARQPFSARRFFEKYPTRILFGTDNDPTFGMYAAHVRQLETEDEWFWPADSEWWRGYGMALRPATLRRDLRRERGRAPAPREGEVNRRELLRAGRGGRRSRGRGAHGSRVRPRAPLGRLRLGRRRRRSPTG